MDSLGLNCSIFLVSGASAFRILELVAIWGLCRCNYCIVLVSFLKRRERGRERERERVRHYWRAESVV